VPGGVTLPPTTGEDAGKVQTIGARYAHGEITLEEAATLGCRACASPGGGCQFLGTAATSQVVAEALGPDLSRMRRSLPPASRSGSTWPAARRGPWCSWKRDRRADILTDDAFHNAMVVHAACGGSPTCCSTSRPSPHAAGLSRPTVEDWIEVNRLTPRLVDVLPNGPDGHPDGTVVPGRGSAGSDAPPAQTLGAARPGRALTVTGRAGSAEVADLVAIEHRRAAANSARRAAARRMESIPDDVIIPPDRSPSRGMTSTV
jgi:xylonate dehydratase